MTASQFGITLVVLCALVEGFAQICLKQSTLAVNGKIRWIGTAIALFLVEALLYTDALQWIGISIAYPLGALCFVIVTLLSRGLLGEVIVPRRWMGVGLILAGCVLIAQ